MAAYPLDKQTASCNSPHDWVMSLAMDLAALCDTYICGGEDGTNGCYLAGFSKEILTLCLPPTPTLPSYRSATGIGYTSKKTI